MAADEEKPKEEDNSKKEGKPKEEGKEEGSEKKDEEQDTKPAIGTKKLIIIMAGAFAVILAIVIIVLVMVLGGGDEPDTNASEGQDNTQSNAQKEAKGEDSQSADQSNSEDILAVEEIPSTGKAVFYTIRPAFVVNFQSSGRAKYLQINVNVMARDEDVIDDVMDNLPLIKNDLVALFSSQEYKTLRTKEGKEALRKEALKVVQNILKKETGRLGVEDILFTSFVMQ